MEEFYHFRCFTESIVLEDLVNFLKTETDVLIIVFEVSHGSHKEHIHATLKFRKAINTFRDKLRKQFPSIFGNKSYSIQKVKNYDSNIKYCCKGKANDYPEVLFSTLSDAEIKQYYTEYWELQNSILKSKAKSNEVNMGCQNDSSLPIVKTKVKTVTWSEKLTKHIIEEYAGLCQGFVDYHRGVKVDYDVLHETLVGIILERLGKVSKNLDEFILIRLYNAQLNAIIQQCGDDKSKSNFKKELAGKIKLKTF